MTQPKSILILGIGNYLMGDEGVGVHLARQMEKMELPEAIEVLDGGTGGFHLMNYFEAFPTIILVDATLDRRPPGAIRLLRPRFSSDFPRAMSTHDIGLKDVVEALVLLGRLPDIYLFAVSIASIQSQKIDLSPDIAEVLPDLKKRILDLCQTQLAEGEGVAV